MKRFIEGENRSRSTLLPECLDDSSRLLSHIFPWKEAKQRYWPNRMCLAERGYTPCSIV